MRCILHIGTEKTATTSIQAFLRRNETRLRRQRVAVGYGSEYTNNFDFFAYFFEGTNHHYFWNHGISNQREKDLYFRYFVPFFDSAVRSAREQGAESIIISSEHLHGRLRKISELDRLAEFLLSRFAEVDVLAYFREQSSLLKSLYSEAIKFGGDVSYIEFRDKKLKDHYFLDYNESCSLWSKVFGKPYVNARIFERRHFFKNDIRLDVLNFVDPRIDTTAVKVPDTAANSSLNRLQVAVGREVNRRYPRYRATAEQKQLRAALWRKIVSDRALKAPPIDEPDPEAIYEMFDARNRNFGRMFCATAGNPFRPPRPASNSADNEGVDADEVAHIVSKMLADLGAV